MKKDAIDLFGGMEKIEKVMTQLVRTNLDKIPHGDVKRLEKDLGDEFSNFVKNENAAVSYKLFRALAGPLTLSIRTALGKPVYESDNQVTYWQNQMKEVPMFIGPAAKSGLATTADMPTVPLDMYVTIRAVTELRTRARS